VNHPLPVGTRVHHCNCLWNHHYTEAECQANPSWGWGTVIGIHSGPYPDKSYEYVIRYDAPHVPGGTTVSQWASYHIDRARPGE